MMEKTQICHTVSTQSCQPILEHLLCADTVYQRCKDEGDLVLAFERLTSWEYEGKRSINRYINTSIMISAPRVQ